MKIAVITTSPQVMEAIKPLLEESSSMRDQLLFLNRVDGEIGLERIDIFSTAVLIIDAQEASEKDLQVISKHTQKYMHPAIIYLLGSASENDLLNLMRAGVAEVLMSPIDGDRLHEALTRLRSKSHIANLKPPRGRIFSFFSSKGGSGSSFISANLAYILASQCSQKVLYIDLHSAFGDAIHYVSDQVGASDVSDIIGLTGLDDNLIRSASLEIKSNFHFLQAPENPEKAIRITPQNIDNLLSVAVEAYDFVIVDLPKVLNATNVQVFNRSEIVFLVCQPVINYLLATAKIVRLTDGNQQIASKLNILLNCFNADDAEVPLSKVEEIVGKKVNWTAPSDFKLFLKSANLGVPLYKLDPSSPLSHKLLEMARLLSNQSMTDNSNSFFAPVLKKLRSIGL